VDIDNPELVSNLASNLGYYSYEKKTGASYVDDEIGSGTMVASIIAAKPNNSSGIAGASYDATILPLKCTYNSSGGVYSDNIRHRIGSDAIFNYYG